MLRGIQEAANGTNLVSFPLGVLVRIGVRACVGVPVTEPTLVRFATAGLEFAVLASFSKDSALPKVLSSPETRLLRR